MTNSNIQISTSRHDEYVCLRYGGVKVYKANLTRANGTKKYSRKSFTRARDAVEYARAVASHSFRRGLKSISPKLPEPNEPSKVFII